MFSCRRQLHSQSTHQLSHSRPLTSKSTSHSHSSKRRRSKSRSHKQRSKSTSSKQRSISPSPHGRRSRSHSPRHSSSSRHHSRSQSPKSRWGTHCAYCMTGILFSKCLHAHLLCAGFIYKFSFNGTWQSVGSFQRLTPAFAASSTKAAIFYVNDVKDDK